MATVPGNNVPSVAKGLRFTIFVKNSKIQNGRHFWKEEKFLRIEQSFLHIYPAGQKFCQNRSISHGLGDTSIFVLCNFIMLTCNIYTSTL